MLMQLMQVTVRPNAVCDLRLDQQHRLTICRHHRLHPLQATVSRSGSEVSYIQGVEAGPGQMTA